MNIKNTPLTDTHISLGARMTPFAGYNMPLVYTSIQEEHMAVRNGVGMFDVSHMGEFIVKGKQALELVQKVTSNDAAKLEIGHAQYSCLPNNDGGIIDDLIVYRLPEDQCADGERAYMLVVNASNIDKDWAWIEKHNDYDTRLINISEHTGLLAVQGPEAVAVVQQLTEVNIGDIGFYHFQKGSVAGIDNVVISATGYTGSGGLELYVDSKQAPALWNAIMEAGAGKVKPCGLGSRDTLRLEMGYCLYGNDITDETSPIEAGLGWITKTKKEADFSSKSIFLQQRSEGVDRKLIGIKVNDRRVPRQGYEIEDGQGNLIGVVTSGTQSPMLDAPIGMGYVQKSYSAVGSKIMIRMRKKLIEAEVVKPPFVQV